MPQIDVFIPVYNDLAHLPAALNSALSQTGVDLRVVVSDNASTDGTSEWLDTMAAKDKRLVIHRNPSNIGLLGNLNRFRELVEAPHYMLLCSDDVLYSGDALSKAAAIVAADPNIVSVYCDLAFIDGQGRRVATRRFRRQGLYSADTALRDSIRKYRNMFGIPLLNRTDAHRALDYPEGLTYVGDVHLSAKAALHGTIYHVPEVLIGNRYTGGNMTASVLRDTRMQFARLAEDFGIKLSSLERAMQHISYPLVMAGKKAFLSAMRWRM